MSAKTIPLVLFLVLQVLPACGAPQSNIRTTGDNTGISFPEATKNARPINGNVGGVSFCQWISGFTDDCNEGFSDPRPEPFVPTSDPSSYRDPSRVLTSGDRERSKESRSQDGVLLSD